MQDDLNIFMVRASQLASGLELDKEEKIKNAISEFIGHKNWNAYDIVKRCRIEIFQGFETFILDEVPLIKFHPVQSEQDGLTITYTRKIEKLWSRKESA